MSIAKCSSIDIMIPYHERKIPQSVKLVSLYGLWIFFSSMYLALRIGSHYSVVAKRHSLLNLKFHSLGMTKKNSVTYCHMRVFLSVQPSLRYK